MCVCLSSGLSFCSFICLSVYLSVSVCLFICLSLSVSLTVNMAFVKGRSTVDAMSILADSLLSQKDAGHHSGAVFLDLSKAFDTGPLPSTRRIVFC